jgi:hypothetical protein
MMVVSTSVRAALRDLLSGGPEHMLLLLDVLFGSAMRLALIRLCSLHQALRGPVYHLLL